MPAMVISRIMSPTRLGLVGQDHVIIIITPTIACHPYILLSILYPVTSWWFLLCGRPVQAQCQKMEVQRQIRCSIDTALNRAYTEQALEDSDIN